MKTTELSKRVKELRKRNGLSQELLADKSGLSLRTIQRIENSETEPRGDTLSRLSIALDSSPDELVDWTVSEDTGFLAALNLSSLGFILFPLLGILIPLIMWISKKDKLKNINIVGKEVLNFQITWTITILIIYIYFVVSIYFRINLNEGYISPSILGNPFAKLFTFGFLYFYNLIWVIINTIRIKEEKAVKYYPKIKFVR